jgi:hypothetical protein
MRRNIVKLSVRSQTFHAVAAAILLSALLGAASCSPAMFAPPAGPGDPAPDAPAAWGEAIATCRPIQTYSALVTLSGNVEGQRFPGITINTALTADGAAYLHAHASGRQLFVLAGRPDRAWLWLREEHRVVEAALADIVDALAAVRIGGAELLAILSGCAVRELDMVSGRRFGDLLAVTTPGGRVFLQQTNGSWTTRAGELQQLSVDYRERAAGWPADVLVGTADRPSPGVRLRFRIEQVVIAEPLAPQLFERPEGAATATPMTLGELRVSGPLRRGR